MNVKEIVFDNQKTGNDYFDLVELSEILQKKPKDHNQFDHHKVSFFIIVIISESTGKHTINYNTHTFNKGTVFTLRKNSIHKFHKSNAKGKFIVFTENFVMHNSDKTETVKLFRLFNEMLGSPKLQLNDNNYHEVNTLIQLIKKEYSEIYDNHSIEIIRNLIQVLIHKLFRLKSKGNNNLGEKKYHSQFIRLQELIENECFENRKVSHYAKKMGVTSRTLNNITQNVINKSAKSFIDDILIFQIKRLIMNSSLSFTEIAYQTGFDEPTNFFKYFKKQTGLSPKQFKGI